MDVPHATVERWLALSSDGAPDFRAELRFEEPAPGALRAAVARVGLPGFTLATLRRPGEPPGPELDLYADDHHAEDVWRAARGDDGAPNVWIYRTVEVTGGTLTIELGYPSSSPVEAASEIRLLHALVHDPALRLVGFWVGKGGQGYDWTPVHQGTSASEWLVLMAG